jgi:hypothetical protein
VGTTCVVYWLGFLVTDPEARVRFLGQERDPLSLVSTTEELLGRNSRGSGLEYREYGRRGYAALTTRHLFIREGWH